ncbi:hypothetical protein [Xanthomonas sp. D-109]|uniref:hypothetical protein n=1 Tax=Xanthomonas sp. D-109 TaxID=2821274 RepID=UPI001AD9ED07|nr:hypothetical protein [Xanthomonas sp. D-109]MBO9880720.1 hypothetical protein [Xanthomonas sp. D-109]
MKNDALDPDSVKDRESFINFVHSLITDRENSEQLERANPKRYQLGGANGWQNSEISTFLECALAGAEAQDDWGNTSAPSWTDLAVFLYLGKIYE